MTVAETVAADLMASGQQGEIVNALSVDVEDYFHVNAFKTVVSRQQWESYPERVLDNTSRILDLLDEHSTRATFFVLGWVAERHPALVREIARRGHEVACHGYGHELIFDIGPEKFRADLKRSLSLLEDLGGRTVKGYRAPSFSITERSMWALDILLEEGFVYDSSMFPIRHDVYGCRHRSISHRIERSAGQSGSSHDDCSLRLLGASMPGPRLGGGYLHFAGASSAGPSPRINHRDRQPGVLYSTRGRSTPASRGFPRR
jgi:polysaccharide deacetylase family protein (PEP-CTERM system associated)